MDKGGNREYTGNSLEMWGEVVSLTWKRYKNKKGARVKLKGNIGGNTLI